MLKRILAFVAASLGGYTTAVLAYSQLNLSNLTDLGVVIGLGDRFATFAHDLVSMTSMYLPIMAAALLVAFLFATLVHHFGSPFWFTTLVTKIRIRVASLGTALARPRLPLRFEAKTGDDSPDP